jgi:hypothetical protein
MSQTDLKKLSLLEFKHSLLKHSILNRNSKRSGWFLAVNYGNQLHIPLELGLCTSRSLEIHLQWSQARDIVILR